MSTPLNLYHIFYITARHGNISSASKELYISQPAVSKSISRLEESLGVTLFQRSSRGVVLTPEGELLYRQVGDAFQSIAFGEEQLRRRVKLGLGQISFGASSTLCKYVLLPCLQTFTQENPHTRISISCQATNQTIQALQNGSLDLGLIGEPEASAGLSFFPVMEITDEFVTTKRYLSRLEERTGLRMDQAGLAEHATFLMLDRDNLTRQYIDRYLNGEGLVLKQILEATSMDLLVEFARIDLGIACVIRNFIKKELESMELIPVPFRSPIIPRKIGFACHENSAPELKSILTYFLPNDKVLN